MDGRPRTSGCRAVVSPDERCYKTGCADEGADHSAWWCGLVPFSLTAPIWRAADGYACPSLSDPAPRRNAGLIRPARSGKVCALSQPVTRSRGARHRRRAKVELPPRAAEAARDQSQRELQGDAEGPTTTSGTHQAPSPHAQCARERPSLVAEGGLRGDEPPRAGSAATSRREPATREPAHAAIRATNWRCGHSARSALRCRGA